MISCVVLLFLCESVVFALCGLFDNGTVYLGINSLVSTIQSAELFFNVYNLKMYLICIILS